MEQNYARQFVNLLSIFLIFLMLTPETQLKSSKKMSILGKTVARHRLDKISFFPHNIQPKVIKYFLMPK